MPMGSWPTGGADRRHKACTLKHRVEKWEPILVKNDVTTND
jgi:hypothetical protein